MRRSLTVALLCACGSPQPAAPPPARPEIDGLAPPLDDADKAIVRTAPAVTVGGVSTPLRYQVLARSGEPIAGVPYGAILDVTGHPVLGDDGAPVDCGGADFTGLVQAHGALFLTQHIECTPSAIYVTRLAQDPDGALRAVTTAPVDEAPVGGGVNHCAGQITPWGTHLGSEEYEPDARRIGADGALPSDDEGWHLMARYLGKPLSEVDPYDYGWLPELTITSAEGSTSIVKHRAMGRFSHELGLVLPDERTVYLSDDGSGGALFLFIADAPRDLSAGALFAARWQQTSDAEATLAWVPLGHTTDAEIAALTRPARLRFSDLMDAADPVDGRCPDGLTSVRTMMGTECLRVKPGREIAASRLESRRYAALLGATTELTKSEGLAWDPGRRAVYLASSAVVGGMTAADPKGDAGGPDHLRLPRNACGVIWALDGMTEAFGSGLVASRARVVVRGEERSYAGQPGLERNSCDLDGIANPDNLAYIAEAGWLIVAEDTKRHENMVLWAIDVDSGAHKRLLTAPWGGELTGTSWSPSIGGFGYLTLTVQHPFRSGFVPEGARVPEGGTRTLTGVIGPFPALAR